MCNVPAAPPRHDVAHLSLCMDLPPHFGLRRVCAGQLWSHAMARAATRHTTRGTAQGFCHHGVAVACQTRERLYIPCI